MSPGRTTGVGIPHAAASGNFDVVPLFGTRIGNGYVYA